MQIEKITKLQFDRICTMEESQFFDLKQKHSLAKICKTVSAFANADGGDLIIGIADKKERNRLQGYYCSPEDANGHIREILSIFSFGVEYCVATFWQAEWQESTFFLHLNIHRTPFIVRTNEGDVYKRLNAQDIKLNVAQVTILERDKGIVSHEDSTTQEKIENILTTDTFAKFSKSVIPSANGRVFFEKERLISNNFVRFAGVLLFDDYPQGALAQTAVKIYRYRTLANEGNRDTLDDTPVTVEGPAIELIEETVKRTIEIIESIPVLGESGFNKIKYPQEAIHETVCNAIIHRDYAINDYVHVRIFDNRVEIESPGRLPGPVTVKNILHQRFARNKRIVRILNKFPSPPNKDVGEGLNTTFAAMKKLNLGAPEIIEGASSVIVRLKHEPLASVEELIVRYIKKYGQINNKTARNVCKIESDSVIRKTFARMINSGLIRKKEGTRGKGTKYILTEAQAEGLNVGRRGVRP
jgi:ATP-dependent DNA helicase RecG